VATNRDALPEVVDRPEVGRLFDGDGPEPLAKALLEALELSQHTTTAAACRTRAEDFSPQRCADAYEALYREVLAGT
jgi:glycosyltransferase involved in cell wall biosynthesis